MAKEEKAKIEATAEEVKESTEDVKAEQKPSEQEQTLESEKESAPTETSGVADNDLAKAEQGSTNTTREETPEEPEEATEEMPVDAAKEDEKVPQAEVADDGSQVAESTIQIETPLIDQEKIEVESGKESNPAETAAPKEDPTTKTPDSGEDEKSLDVFDEVASGDGDASDPSRTKAETSDNLESGDGDASDPSKAGDAEGTDPVRENPKTIDLQDSGDGDASDPSRKGVTDTSDPSNSIDTAVDDLASGDGDASDPSKAGDAERHGPGPRSSKPDQCAGLGRWRSIGPNAQRRRGCQRIRPGSGPTKLTRFNPATVRLAIRR